MDKQPETPAEMPSARDVARLAIEEYLVDREAEWRDVAEQAADGDEAGVAESADIAWQGAERHLLLWRQDEDLEPWVPGAVAGRARQKVEDFDLRRPQDMSPEQLAGVHEEFEALHRHAYLIEQGLRELGYNPDATPNVTETDNE
ncbi:hypothetical protein QMK19_38795 [Streptomyces sp. H10-C2]|uniref:hypothetical protein n=1 Tax=unclassified Streptomyces TaxID=2593676 RepID=UPI0024B9B8C6|nr:MULTISPECIES: hypothetical protein [unclassified Streptomyces]MDJ0347139.1 hypothetical protein [Streptomyces sp. PH10-H1]MDJ0375385.1 hypothetical protein [Streptomyces sp. H10-C2]